MKRTGVFEKAEMKALFDRRAARYDVTANLFYLAGFREFRYRKKAVEALGLHSGDRVLEPGCGTGLNFSLIQRRIGPEGRIIGVDLSGAMLQRARDRVERNGWRNVNLCEADAAEFRSSEQADAVLPEKRRTNKSRRPHRATGFAIYRTCYCPW